jgi:hypothetical protein
MDCSFSTAAVCAKTGIHGDTTGGNQDNCCGGQDYFPFILFHCEIHFAAALFCCACSCVY